MSFHEIIFVSNRVTEHFSWCNAFTVAYIFVNAFFILWVSVFECVNSTILVPGYPGDIFGCIVYVDWSFDDMLIIKRRQYLPDLCNDLLYSGVRLLRKFENRYKFCSNIYRSEWSDLWLYASEENLLNASSLLNERKMSLIRIPILVGVIECVSQWILCCKAISKRFFWRKS